MTLSDIPRRQTLFTYVSLSDLSSPGTCRTLTFQGLGVRLLDQGVRVGRELRGQRLQAGERGGARGAQRVQLLEQQQLEAGRGGEAARQAARVLVGRAVVPGARARAAHACGARARARPSPTSTAVTDAALPRCSAAVRKLRAAG